MIYSCIINNGFTSGYFNLTRGVRQGDPLSPYLFIVAVEVLALALRQENSIKGVKINKTEIKLLQYADDTTCFISDIKSAKLFLKMLKDFENIPGLKVNIEKLKDFFWVLCKISQVTQIMILVYIGQMNLLKY